MKEIKIENKLQIFFIILSAWILLVTMEPISFPAEQLLQTGLYIVGYAAASSILLSNEERFCACFGASAQAFSAIWIDIQSEELGDAQVVNPQALHFLMTAYWMKSYQTEMRMEGIFRLSRKTIRSFAWKYALAFQALKSMKVRVRLRVCLQEINNDFSNIFFSV